MDKYHRIPHWSQTGHSSPAVIKRRRIVDEHPLVNRIPSDNILAEAGRSVSVQATVSRWLHMVTPMTGRQEGWLL
jgi:hypothetical protein